MHTFHVKYEGIMTKLTPGGSDTRGPKNISVDPQIFRGQVLLDNHPGCFKEQAEKLSFCEIVSESITPSTTKLPQPRSSRTYAPTKQLEWK